MGKKTNSQKRRNESEFENHVPVFRLKPINNESGKIAHVGYVTNTDKLLDELMDPGLSEGDSLYNKDSGKNTLYFGKFGKYHITANIYKCNLSGQFVLDNKIYPLYYINVYYKSTVVSGSLFEYYFTFNMNNESKRLLTDPKKYKDAEVTGSYSHRISIGDEVRNNKYDLFSEFLAKKYGEVISKNDTCEIKKTKAEEDALTYDYLFDEHQYTYAYVSATKIKGLFMKLCHSEKFCDLISVALSARDKDRRDQAGLDSDEEFQIPDEKNVIVMGNDEDIMNRFKDALTL